MLSGHLCFRPEPLKQIPPVHPRRRPGASLTFVSLALVGVGAGGGDAQDAADGVGGAGRVRAHRGHLRHGARGHCAEGEGSQGPAGGWLVRWEVGPQPAGTPPSGLGRLGEGCPGRAPVCRGHAPWNSGRTWVMRAALGPLTQVLCGEVGAVSGEDGQQRELTEQKGTRNIRWLNRVPIQGCRKRGGWSRERGEPGPSTSQSKNNLLNRQDRSPLAYPSIHSAINICTHMHTSQQNAKWQTVSSFYSSLLSFLRPVYLHFNI